MGHLQRFGLGALFIMATLVLGLIIDAVGYHLLELNYQFGVQDSFLAPVLDHLEGVMVLLVPMLLLGIVLWLVWGSIQQERAEEVRRRVR